MQYEIGTVAFELSRKCNMGCNHCLRGGVQNRDMSDEIIEATVEKMAGKYVGSLLIGGGEPSLAAGRIEYLVDAMHHHGVSTSMCSLVHNGKRMTHEFKEQVARLCEVSEYVYMNVSFDQFHDEINVYQMRENVSDLQNMCDVDVSWPVKSYNTWPGPPEKRHLSSMQLIVMGRAARKTSATGAVRVAPYDVIVDNAYGVDPLHESMFYVDVNGNVWPSCDLSYNFMAKKKRYSVGNILDDGFDWMEAAVRFNAKHSDEFPLMLTEPGYEGCYWSSHEKLTDDEYMAIDESLRMIEKIEQI